jgi:glucosamine 6-phosphate synthetase-like amidotransferase/phosphosugar isomerase protein
MCGILGIGFQNGTTFTNSEMARFLLRELFNETEIRGYDATGVAFVNRREINVLKAPIAVQKFVATREFTVANRELLTLSGKDSTISVIGHCRAKTKGTPKNNNNNHPIVAGSVVGVHNGIIDNDDELFDRFKGYYKSFSRKGEVDSEIIFRLIDYFVNIQSASTSEAIRRMAAFVKGSYVCAMVDKRNPFLLYIFRQQGSVTLYHYGERGVVVFASLESAITNAVQGFGLENELGEPTIVTIPQYSGMCINLFSNSMSYIKIERPVGYSNY